MRKILFLSAVLSCFLSVNLWGQCDDIEKSVDKFTGDISYNSPRITSREISPIIVFKHITKKDSIFMIGLSTHGHSINFYKKGVIILFEDSSKLSYPDVKIDVNVDKELYRYNAYVYIPETERKIYETKKIVAFRLFIYDEDISPKYQKKYLNYFNCISKL